jgi:hypothetical protein
MSRSTNTRRRRFALAAGAAATVLAAVGGFLAFGGGATSANYSASAPVNVHLDGGVLKLTAAGNLNFTKLVPGVTQTQTVTFNNPGNVPADHLKIGLPVSVSDWHVPAGQTPDWSQLQVSVDGVLAATSVTSAPTSVDMGALGVSDPKTVTVRVTLVSAGDNPAGDAKDNQFQGVSLTGQVTGTARTS